LVEAADADLALTWLSAATDWSDSISAEVVELYPVYEVPIYLGLLSCSNNDIFAKYFMDFVTSAEQTDILQRNGLRKRRTQIF
jgi:ABC-type molybdate transport system substrate-binding protein